MKRGIDEDDAFSRLLATSAYGAVGGVHVVAADGGKVTRDERRVTRCGASAEWTGNTRGSGRGRGRAARTPTRGDARGNRRGAIRRQDGWRGNI